MRKNNALAIKTEVPKKQFHCDICNKSGFPTAYKLKSHLFIHNAIPPRFKCEFCDKEFYRCDAYNRHMATHKNSDRKQKLHECEYCDRGFVDKRNLTTHLLNVHDEILNTKQRHKCVECGATYCEERLLKHHIRKEHLKITKEPNYVLKNLNETWIESIKDSKMCVQITKIQPNKLTIKSCTIKRKDDIMNDKELNIIQKYKASVFANKHNNYYSKAICDYCSKEMLKKSIVVHIRERHLKLRRFQCEYCSKSFKRHYQLCMHNCDKILVKKEEP